jgi:hypothetical protein
MDIQAQLTASTQRLVWQRQQQALDVRIQQPRPAPETEAVPSDAGAQSAPPSLNEQILTAFLKTFLGLRLDSVERVDPSDWQASPIDTVAAEAPLAIRFERVEERFEAESVRLDIRAQVDWGDGRQTKASLSLRMERQLYQHQVTRLEIGQRQDPLLVNLDGQGGALSQRRVDFDLRADGQLRAMPTPAAGNALLARDIDGNGRIDDGRELPGAISGDVWRSLRGLDDNQDGLLDASDNAFEQLRLLRYDSDGAQHLLSLASAGIRALSLDAVDSPYSLTAADGERLGEILSSGFYLHDDGQLGVAQRIDFFL